MAKDKDKDKEETAVAERPKTEVAVVNWDQFAGQGQEQADAGDYAIPFLMVLQKLSPQIDDIPDAKPGMVIETATNVLLNRNNEGFDVVPCYFRKDLVEWKPRESGGGFIKAHGWNLQLLEQCSKNDRGQMVMPNGNMLVDTKYHYVLAPTNGGFMQAVISMTSTQLKKSRKWMTMMNTRKMKKADGATFVPPSFAYFYRMTSIKEENEKGQWFGWVINQGPEVQDKSLIREAILFHNAIKRGDVKVSDPDAEMKDDIPF